MFEILQKKAIAPDTYWFEAHAPLVAQARRAGQFMIVCPHEKAERIPLSLAGSNPEKGGVYFVVQAIGKTTREIVALDVGDSFFSIVGPLGHPSPVENYGTVACLGGGYGVGALIPIATALRQAGNRVIGIIGARTRNLILLEKEMREACDEVRLCTNDGSAGMPGLVTDALRAVLDEETTVNHTFAVGPVPMMAAVARMTKPLGIGCTVSLNALMVDGTGMCGGCRVNVGKQSRFACFDGPDFDGHQVDFEELTNRQKWYAEHERRALEHHRNGTDGHAPLCPRTSSLEEIEFTIRAWGKADVPPGVNLNNGPLSAKERMAIQRQRMPEQPPEVRRRNFDEVALGYSVEQARAEAYRCLDCKNPKCVEGCPVGVDIPRFIRLVRERKYLEAARVIKETNVLPAVCGRVCPQETQCEVRCVLQGKREPVAIGRLERFVADYARAHESGESVTLPAPTGKKAAVVGSGPASLTVAGDLAAKGHEVHVFEALHRLGGVLVYGIPEFRLPNAIVDSEIEALKRMGVRFHVNVIIGKSKTVDELLERDGFDTVFLGTGAGLPRMMNIPGENLKGIYTANEFLTRVNLMRADRFPEYGTPVTVGKRVAVVGCGNTAMDAARVSLRLGAEEVTIVYRRTLDESPARAEEIEHARQEGVRFALLTNPSAWIGDETGWVREMECVRMELGEPDATGRKRPVPAEGSAFRMPVDTVITALGFGVNPLVPSTTAGLELDRWGVIKVDKEKGATSRSKVFAGGDSITGGSTVIMAMGQGRIAANAMHEFMMTEETVSIL
ncbi:MAG: NADPH-dependent glutamate synthase [bacterium]